MEQTPSLTLALLSIANSIQKNKYPDVDFLPSDTVADKKTFTEYIDTMLSVIIAQSDDRVLTGQYEKKGSISLREIYDAMSDVSKTREQYTDVYLGVLDIQVIPKDEQSPSDINVEQDNFDFVVNNTIFTQELWDKLVTVLDRIAIPKIKDIGLRIILSDLDTNFNTLKIPKYINSFAFEREAPEHVNELKYTTDDILALGFVDDSHNLTDLEKGWLDGKFIDTLFVKKFINTKLIDHNPHKLPYEIYIRQVEIDEKQFDSFNLKKIYTLYKAHIYQEFERPQNVEGDYWYVNISE